MSRPPLPPAQIIEAARKRLAEARSAETVRLELFASIGMLDTLADLGLIDMDTRYDLRAEFDNLADSRRALSTAGNAQ